MLSGHTYNDDRFAIHQTDSDVVSTKCLFEKGHFKVKKARIENMENEGCVLSL
jgi:hypothetical protein